MSKYAVTYTNTFCSTLALPSLSFLWDSRWTKMTSCYSFASLKKWSCQQHRKSLVTAGNKMFTGAALRLWNLLPDKIRMTSACATLNTQCKNPIIQSSFPLIVLSSILRLSALLVVRWWRAQKRSEVEKNGMLTRNFPGKRLDITATVWYNPG